MEEGQEEGCPRRPLDEEHGPVMSRFTSRRLALLVSSGLGLVLLALVGHHLVGVGSACPAPMHARHHPPTHPSRLPTGGSQGMSAVPTGG